GGGGTISGNDTTSVVISGTLDEVNADLSTLSYTGTVAGADVIDIAANDGNGGTDSKTIDVTVQPPPPPGINGPAREIVGNNIESPIDGISVETGAGLPADTEITLTLKEPSGGLDFYSANGADPSSTSAASDVTLTGTAAQLNTMLSELVYAGGVSNITV